MSVLGVQNPQMAAYNVEAGVTLRRSRRGKWVFPNPVPMLAASAAFALRRGTEVVCRRVTTEVLAVRWLRASHDVTLTQASRAGPGSSHPLQGTHT